MRILIVRTDRIGDVILSTPVIRNLRRAFPEAHLAFLVSPGSREVVEGHPDLDEILVDDAEGAHRGGGGFIELRGTIREKRFDAAVVLHPTLRLAMLAALAGIPLRVGTGYRAYSALFNRRLREHRRRGPKHELQYNLSLLEPLGIRPVELAPRVCLAPGDRAVAERVLEARGLSRRPFIIIHPGSGGSARDWPLGYFAQLADRIQRDLGVRVLVTGGEQEVGLVGRMVDLTETRPAVVVGETTLKQLGALMERAELFVSNSTGPMHLAAAVGTRVLAFFPTLFGCRARRWGPWGEGHIVMEPPVPECPRCEPEKCRYGDCMRMIAVEDAFGRIRVALHE
jgi:ADP-heptose:LPS heptosyltransferase